jgi:hypothetical protein
MPTEICPISQEAMIYPVATPCGHKFDRVNIVGWLNSRSNGTCPICRHPVLTNQLRSVALAERSLAPSNLVANAELLAARSWYEAEIYRLNVQVASLEQRNTQTLQENARLQQELLRARQENVRLRQESIRGEQERDHAASTQRQTERFNTQREEHTRFEQEHASLPHHIQSNLISNGRSEGRLDQNITSNFIRNADTSLQNEDQSNIFDEMIRASQTIDIEDQAQTQQQPKYIGVFDEIHREMVNRNGAFPRPSHSRLNFS